MIETREVKDKRIIPNTRTKGAYQEATLGFRNYWYPIFSSREITERPRRLTLCGDRIVLMRRKGNVYAIAESCPHRGTSLALYPEKTYPFKGSTTITCPYHGWTFDVTDGKCVAVVCEGPESRIPGTVKIRTYPVEERKGMVWIWMGDMKPVALEEDWPKFIFDEDSIVKMINRVKKGNWRWHAENGPDGHAPLVHMNSPRMWFRPSGPQNRRGTPVSFEEDGMKGVRTEVGDHAWDPYPYFPGLGRWPAFPLWRKLLFFPWGKPKEQRPNRRKPIRGALKGGMCLPGYFSLSTGSWPVPGFLSFETYLPLDANHYGYVQIASFRKKNPIHDLLRNIQYYFWAKPISQIMFNNGDAELVPQTTRFQAGQPNNWVDIARNSWNDELLAAWRKYCDENARGVGSKYQQ
jgi:nitrite reductase/ring-hydroxylating ferredoxin subunit